MTNEKALIETQHRAKAFGQIRDLEPLVEKLANSRIVMLGESTHGTHEFYELRRLISEWLIVRHGFNLIAVEGDWPSLVPFHRHITRDSGPRDHESARTVLQELRRWPTWMWANTEVVRMGDWLKTHNSRLPSEERVGFLGLDVYSLFESMDWVTSYLDRKDPFLARRIRHLYSCFERFEHDEIAYAKSLATLPEGCRDEVTQALQALLEARFAVAPTHEEREDLFDAQQNARIVANAESYYRSMIEPGENSWNVRDQHMMDTLDIMLKHYGPGSRAIVWAHNSHVGDFRATDMITDGLVNLGGIARERHGEENVALVGFSTYEGDVIASPAWDGPIESMKVPPAKSGTWEEIFHLIAQTMPLGRFFISFDRDARMGALSSVLGHRAIGVVYDPRHERWGNYVPTNIARRYDALIHVDTTRALEPLLLPFDSREIPETWPAGQ